MTSPFPAVAAPEYSLPPPQLNEVATVRKAFVTGLNTPTLVALRGAKMTSPLPAVAAPEYLSVAEMVLLISTHVRWWHSRRQRSRHRRARR
eukprot:7386305-Prymnesium_polylepis.2